MKSSLLLKVQLVSQLGWIAQILFWVSIENLQGQRFWNFSWHAVRNHSHINIFFLHLIGISTVVTCNSYPLFLLLMTSKPSTDVTWAPWVGIGSAFWIKLWVKWLVQGQSSIKSQNPRSSCVIIHRQIDISHSVIKERNENKTPQHEWLFFFLRHLWLLMVRVAQSVVVKPKKSLKFQLFFFFLWNSFQTISMSWQYIWYL